MAAIAFDVCVLLLAAGMPGQPGGTQVDTRRAAPLPLVFWTEKDIVDPLGRIEFDAHPLEPCPPTTGYPNMLFGCAAPREEGGSWLYGWELVDWSDRSRRNLAITRAWTMDGREFHGAEQVFLFPKREWQGFVNLARRSSDGTLFAFSWAPGALHVFASGDGKDWKVLSDKAYGDHDAMCVTWDAERGEFRNFQTTLEPFAKRYPDNIGNLRRVLSFRRSRDAVHWESVSPPFLMGEKLWKPDSFDPLDLEFYRACVFPLGGRKAMLLVDYVPPPQEANSRRATTKHGPRYLTEWAISRDGENWERPFRARDAAEKTIWSPLQGPLTVGNLMYFYEREAKSASLPLDRVFFATCRANGEFSTPLFAMPASGLALNADVRWRAGEDPGQAYLLAELQDEGGDVIGGYERANCLVENADARGLALRWGGKSGIELAGRPVRMRLYLRDAKVYGLSQAAP